MMSAASTARPLCGLLTPVGRQPFAHIMVKPSPIMPKSAIPSAPEAPPATLEALTARIQRDFADMTPQFQVGARHLIDFPLDVPVASMRKIAEQAGVQPATLLRLAKSLGYAGWPE